MCLFTFTYYDHHYVEEINEDKDVITVPKDLGWYKFKVFIDVNERRIDRFYSYVIFNEEEVPLECTCVLLNDGEKYFAVNKIETFEKNYRENYLTLFKEPEPIAPLT